MNKRSRITAALALSSALVLVSGSALAVDPSVVSKEWNSYLESFAPLGEKFVPQMSQPDDPQLRQELYQNLFAGIVGGYFARFHGTLEQPQFRPNLNEIVNFATVNPDDAYTLADLDPKGTYRISGFRGSVRVLDFQFGGGNYYQTGQYPFPFTISNHHIGEGGEITSKKTGAFSVIVSAQRPAGYKGAWWQLGDKASYVMVRQVSSDWAKEVDARFAIERLDTPPETPRMTVEQLQKNIGLVKTWADGQTQLSFDWLKKNVIDKGMINKIFIRHFPEGGLTTQKYGEGIFKIEPDEALILETEIPKPCVYWSIHLNDMLWRTLDSYTRQGNLNDTSARLDKDGKFRAVISVKDPGVPNWLDTSGYTEGDFVHRWLDCADLKSDPVMTKVKLADIRKYLPADTPVITPEQRKESNRARNRARQMRKRW